MTVADIPEIALELPQATDHWDAWREYSAGALGRTYGGLSGKSKADFETGTARFVPFTAVLERAELKPGELPRVRVKDGEQQNEVCVGDVLFNGSSETPDELALGAWVSSLPGPTFLNSFCFGYRLRKASEADPQFLAYWFRGPAGRELLYALAQGAIRYNLSKTQFKGLRLPLPALDEQRAIAEALSDVDALVASLQRLIAKKREIKQGAMQRLLTGKTRLAGFGGEWRDARLGELFQFKNGLNKAKAFFGHGTPIVNYMDVMQRNGLNRADVRGLVSVSPEEAKTYSARVGDVFFTRTSETVAEIGLSSVLLEAIPNAVFSGFVLRGRPLDDRVANEFKKYCFRSEAVRAQIISSASYTTRALTNGRSLAQVVVRLPSPAEQRAIGVLLGDMDAEIDALGAHLAKIRNIKQGMMQQLLTGRTRLVPAEAAA